MDIDHDPSLPLEPTPFPKALEQLINGCSRENESNTPDFILASYLMGCLNVWESHTRWRDKWSGFGKETTESIENLEARATLHFDKYAGQQLTPPIGSTRSDLDDIRVLAELALSNPATKNVHAAKRLLARLTESACRFPTFISTDLLPPMDALVSMRAAVARQAVPTGNDAAVKYPEQIAEPGKVEAGYIEVDGVPFESWVQLSAQQFLTHVSRWSEESIADALIKRDHYWLRRGQEIVKRPLATERHFARFLPYEHHMGVVLEYMAHIRKALPSHVADSFKWLQEFREQLAKDTPLDPNKEVWLRRAADTQPKTFYVVAEDFDAICEIAQHIIRYPDLAVQSCREAALRVLNIRRNGSPPNPDNFKPRQPNIEPRGEWIGFPASQFVRYVAGWTEEALTNAVIARDSYFQDQGRQRAAADFKPGVTAQADIKRWRSIAEVLWGLLDDIDTLADSIKPSFDTTSGQSYFKAVEATHKRRFRYLTPDDDSKLQLSASGEWDRLQRLDLEPPMFVANATLYSDIATCVEAARMAHATDSPVLKAALRVQQYAVFRVKPEGKAVDLQFEDAPVDPSALSNASVSASASRKQTSRTLEKSDAPMSLDVDRTPNSTTAAPENPAMFTSDRIEPMPEKWSGAHPPPADPDAPAPFSDRDFAIVWEALTTGQHSKVKTDAREAFSRIKQTCSPGGLGLGQTPSEATYATYDPSASARKERQARNAIAIKHHLHRIDESQPNADIFKLLLTLAHEPYDFDALTARLVKLEQWQEQQQCPVDAPEDSVDKQTRKIRDGLLRQMKELLDGNALDGTQNLMARCLHHLLRFS